MQYVIRYDVAVNQSTAYRQWLEDNEMGIAANAPDGWTYQGTFFAVRSFGEYSNETRWDLRDYAALGSGFGNDENVRLMQEWFGFVDQHRPIQATLYKSADEVAILPGS